MTTLENFIGGRRVEAEGGARGVRCDPADARERLVEFAESTAGDVGCAVEAARAAFPAWRDTPAPARGDVLARAARGLKDGLDSLAEILTREQGKTLAESRSELTRAAEALEFCAGETRRLAGETLPSEAPGRVVMTVREPLGVVGVITPWNYPAQLAAWKIGPALAAGNTVVFKPSELTPWISVRLVEILAAALDEVGAPPGTVNLVTGAGPIAGTALANHPGVAAVSFTGSTRAGREIRTSVTERGGLALCEMGGKNPLVVLEDADVELAASACVRGAFGNAGQRCTATSRAIVLPAVLDAFTEAVVAGARALRLGSGLDPETDMGPLSSEAGRAKVLRATEAARRDGAKVLCGGTIPADPALAHGWFFPPTVLTGLPADHAIAQEEVFGPVVLIQPAPGDREALDLANGVQYGLSASVYTRDLDRAFTFTRGFESGIVHVNSPTVGGETHVPFGGMKATANGGRERGRPSVDFYTRWKTIYLDTAHR